MSSSSSASPDAPSRRWRWVKRGLIALLVLANVAVGFIYWRLTSLEDVVRSTASTIPDVVADLDPVEGEPIDGESDGDDDGPRLDPIESPRTFLVIGSDSRESLDDLSDFGDFEGQRADVIILVKIFPTEDRAMMLSIPRDLWVEIPGEGEARINAAYSEGDAGLMVRTVKEALGVPINHYVEVDFAGFQAIVDELGGVTIDFPYPARDLKSNLDVDAGVQRLDGEQALAYARSRSYQELRNGRWVSVEANDIGRTKRQQALLFAILSEASRPSSLAEAGSVVEAFAEHISIDSALAEASLVQLAFQMRGIDAADIEAATLPTVFATRGTASVLLRDDPAATEMLTAFRAGDPLVESTDTPVVSVLNANGVPGSAGFWSENLAEQGFEIRRVADAETTGLATTQVLVPPGQVALGDRLVDALGFGEVAFGTIEPGEDAVVLLGQDAPDAETAVEG